MSMGGSSQPAQNTTSGQGTSTSTPQLYNWRDILPPWVQSGQQAALPWLMSRAQQGLLPQEERDLWGQVKSEIGSSGDMATKNLSRQIASSGMSPNSPAVAGGYADLAMDRMSTTSKAALDFAKMKMGAKDTAIGQMLSALYTPSPAAVGNTSTSQQTSNSWPSSSGGGK
jgi:hypothetical protein